MSSRAFTLTAVDGDKILDTITVDEDSGEITFASGAAEDMFDTIIPDAGVLDTDQIAEAILGWPSNGYLQFAEVSGDQTAAFFKKATPNGPSAPHDPLFEKKHKRGFGGHFAKKTAASVKTDVKGDSGGVEEVKPGPASAIVGQKGYMPRQLRPGAGPTPPSAPPPTEIERAKQRLANAERMHGPDRSKWSKTDQAAAKKLDALLGAPAGGPAKPRRAPGAIDKAIATGQPDALAEYDRPALMRAVKKRNLMIPARATSDDLRKILHDNHGTPIPDAPSVGSKKDPVLVAGSLTELPASADGEKRARAMLDEMNLKQLKEVRSELGTVSKTGKTKQAIKDDIVHGTITFRRNAETMGKWGKEGGFVGNQKAPTSTHGEGKGTFLDAPGAKKGAHERSAKTGTFLDTPAKVSKSKPVTSKMNAHSLSKGDVILEQGKPYTIKSTRMDTTNGQSEVVLDIVDAGGRGKTLRRHPNTPIDRVTGGRSGGSGTFALEADDENQTADAAFEAKHHRGTGGLFGALLRDLAHVGADDHAGDLYLPDGPNGDNRYFDWNGKDHLGQDMLEIGGSEVVDEDEQGNPIETQAGAAQLHMSPNDMKGVAAGLAKLLLMKHLEGDRPLTPDDPRTPLIATFLETTPNMGLEFDGNNPWGDDQELRWYRDGDGFGIHAVDDAGSDVTVALSPDEMQQLHAQVMRHVRGDGAQPGQTAAFEYQEAMADFAAGMEEWASYEFDVSRMPEQLQRHWTEGPGAVKIRWGSRGAFRRCQRQLRSEGVPLHMVDGSCANLYRRATGKYPGAHRGNRRGMAAMPINVGSFQTAACGCDTTPDPADDMFTPPDERIPMDAPSGSMGWSGPLAPIDVATGDRRRFSSGALSTRQLPLPFRWQEQQSSGHDGAVVVGALTGYQIADDGTIMGEGYFLDPEIIPQVKMAQHLVEHGLVGPSVDLEPSMDVSFRDPATGNTFDPHECGVDGSCPAKPEALITRATIAGATLVPITAFAEARAPKLYPRTVGDDIRVMSAGCGCADQTAAVRASGWDDMPIADREHPWDRDAAVQRVAQWSGVAEDGSTAPQWDRFGRAFLWYDDSGSTMTMGAFKFPIADVIDGELTIIPRAVFAAAARLDSAGIPASAKTDVRGVIDDLYDQMADEFDDQGMHSPWDTAHTMATVAEPEGCGCAEKFANSAAASQTAASVFDGMDPYPADVFDTQLDDLTPLTIEERPGETFARISGHIASWSSCNRGYRGVCVPPPKSRTGYREFHVGAVRTDKGMLPAGKIVMGEGHPDVGAGVKIARAFYDATSKTVAFGRMSEDKFGPKFSGVLAPGVTAQEATMLLMSPPSGDWKGGELMAVLAVNVPGHVVPQAHMVGAQPVNMVAAGRWLDPAEDALYEMAAQFAAIEWEAEAATLAATFAG